jgi:hypothetical protein
MVLDPKNHDFQAHWQAPATRSGKLGSHATSSADARATNLGIVSGISCDLNTEFMSFPEELDSESAWGKGFNCSLE